MMTDSLAHGTEAMEGDLLAGFVDTAAELRPLPIVELDHYDPTTELVVKEMDLLTEFGEPDSPFHYTDTGVELRRTPTPADEPQFREDLTMMVALDRSLQWVLGDLQIIGEQYFPAALTEVLDKRYSELTKRNAKRVCTAIPLAARKPDLEFGHHEPLAAVKDPAKRAELLDKASKEGWTVRETRTQVRAADRADQPRLDRRLTQVELVIRTGIYRGYAQARVAPPPEGVADVVAAAIWAEMQDRGTEWGWE